jgi:ribosomal protein S18 acetylase RimI-like enzyme
VTIRAYVSADRAAVRELCCEAAYGDVPLESFYPDRVLFADLMTRYYLKWEPGSSWVVVAEGRVVGYLLGCGDSRRQRRVQLTRVVPAALAGFVRRGGLWNGATWRLLAANLGRRSIWSATRSAGFDHDRYPAHLHVGLDAEFRGRHLGHRLVEAFLAQLSAAGVPGVHAVVLAENAPAGRFFERLGFCPLAHGPALRRPGQAGAPGKIVYGRSLAGRPA